MTAPNPLRSLSVSRAEKFDHAQYGGCERRSWFEELHDQKPEQSAGQEDGVKGHALLATYLATGQAPQGRVKMGKAVTGAILKGELPVPGSDLRVEQRFDGQAQYDAAGAWIPLRPETTLHLGGVPWDGFIDLRFRRSDIVDGWDHKFSSDIRERAQQRGPLLQTIQHPVYALDSLRVWPDARLFRLVDHYVSRKGVESFIRSTIITLDQLLERKEGIEAIARRMQEARGITSQEDVPFNRKSCSAYAGCPHQSICTAFKEKKLNLTADELKMFEIEPDVTPKPAREPGEDDGLDDLFADAAPASEDIEAIAPTKAPAGVPAPTASAPAPQPPREAPAAPAPAQAVKGGQKWEDAADAVEGLLYQMPDGTTGKAMMKDETSAVFRVGERLQIIGLREKVRLVVDEAQENLTALMAGKDFEGEPTAFTPEQPAPKKRGRPPGSKNKPAEEKSEVRNPFSQPNHYAEPDCCHAPREDHPTKPAGSPEPVALVEPLFGQRPGAFTNATLPAADTDGNGAPVNPPEPTPAPVRVQIPDSHDAVACGCAPVPPAGLTITVRVELGPQTMALLGKLLSR